jgi:hypothetical protein
VKRLAIILSIGLVLLSSALSGTASALYLKHRYFTHHHTTVVIPAGCDVLTDDRCDPLTDSDDGGGLP